MKNKKKSGRIFVAIFMTILAFTACTIESDYVDALNEKIETDLNPPDTSITYQLTAIAGTGGTILSPNISPLEVVKDDSISIKAQADTGYLFGYWAITAGEAVIDDELQADSAIILSNGDATIHAIFTDVNAPDPPVVSGDSKTNNSTPTWTWSSSGGDGNGSYRYKLDDSSMISGATETTETSFTPATALTDGNHTLFVQEKDSSNNWSNLGSHTIEIDTAPPDSPIFHESNDSKTASQQPTWTWTNGSGDGIRVYRFKLDDSNLSDILEIDETTSTSYTPAEDISEGTHTLYVQEKDDVGNWSSTASHPIEIDLTGPTAPTISSSSQSWDITPTWSWFSTASDGTGIYRYRLDNDNLSGEDEESVTTYTSGTLSNGTHRLFVQEKDDVDNWGSIGNVAVNVSWGAPGLTSPSNQGTSSSIEVSVDWTDVYQGGVYASEYYVQLDDDANFNSPMAWTVSNVHTDLHTSTRLTPGTEYFWHVRAKTPDGDWGEYSSRWSFTAAHRDRDVIFSPAPGGGYILYDDDDYPEMEDTYYNIFTLPTINFVQLPGDYRYLEIAREQASTDSVLNTPSGFQQNSATSTAIGSGLANTNTLLNSGAVSIAKSYSYEYQGCTYSDWFLPSSEVLKIVSLLYDGDPQDNITAAAYWSSSYVTFPFRGAEVVIFKNISIGGTSYSPGDIVVLPESGDPSGQVDIGVLTARMF